MPYVRVWIHAVWSTKERRHYLSQSIRQDAFEHIRQNAKEKEIFMNCSNGYTDHIHCLISLGTEQTISKVIQLIKGKSSFWINKNKLTQEKFEWQDEYFAASVSESKLEATRNYILNQEDHRQKKTFAEEYDEFILKYGFQKFG